MKDAIETLQKRKQLLKEMIDSNVGATNEAFVNELNKRHTDNVEALKILNERNSVDEGERGCTCQEGSAIRTRCGFIVCSNCYGELK